MKLTIEGAIEKVLDSNAKPMSANEIYDQIKNKNLFTFNAKSPISVVQATIRKTCAGIDNKKSKPIKKFKQVDGSKYALI